MFKFLKFWKGDSKKPTWSVTGTEESSEKASSHSHRFTPQVRVNDFPPVILRKDYSATGHHSIRVGSAAKRGIRVEYPSQDTGPDICVSSPEFSKKGKSA